MLDTLRTRQFPPKHSRSLPPKEKIIHSKHNGFMNTREDTAIHTEDTAPQHQHVDRLTPIPPPQAAAMAPDSGVSGPLPGGGGIGEIWSITLCSDGVICTGTMAGLRLSSSDLRPVDLPCSVRAALEVPPECGLCRELLKAALPRRLPTR